jgi:hypothetical protein
MAASSEQPRWREPDLPPELPDFIVRSARSSERRPTSKAPASASRAALIVWIIVGVGAVAAVTAGGRYWLINSRARHIPAEVASAPRAPENAASPVSGVAPTAQPEHLVAGLPPPVKPPVDDNATPAPPPAPAPGQPAETVSPAATPPTSETSEAKAVATPSNDVFRVRFDSKVPGLTPTGIRTLDTALRALDNGRKVQIAIEGCDGTDGTSQRADCATLTRELKRILVDSGITHPAALIAGPP